MQLLASFSIMISGPQVTTISKVRRVKQIGNKALVSLFTAVSRHTDLLDIRPERIQRVALIPESAAEGHFTAGQALNRQQSGAMPIPPDTTATFPLIFSTGNPFPTGRKVLPTLLPFSRLKGGFPRPGLHIKR